MGWRVRGVRGATTVEANTYAALERAVIELMEAIEVQNAIDPREIVSATFSATTDIDVVFPAKIARSRSHWEHVPLLDVQQMYVEGSLARCIRVLIHVNTPLEQHQIKHVYLNGARDLRPDLVFVQV